LVLSPVPLVININFHGLYVQFVMVLQQVPALRRFKRLYLINLPVILYESLIAL